MVCQRQPTIREGRAAIKKSSNPFHWHRLAFNYLRCASVALALALSGCTPAHTAGTAPKKTRLPGTQPDGSVLLPNQWSLRPAGKQVELEDFPVNIAVHPSGQFAAAVHCGYSEHQILIIDLETEKVVSRAHLSEAFYGLRFSHNGRELFASGAGTEQIHRFDFREGRLGNHRRIHLREPDQRGVPAGLTLNEAGTELYAANVWGHKLSRVKLTPQPIVTEILLSGGTDARPGRLVPPSIDEDTAAAEKRSVAGLYPSRPEDSFPYACEVDEASDRLYVSLWSQSAVAVIDLKTDQVIARWATEDHPCEMTLARSGKVLYVANASRNTVSVLDTGTGKHLETIWAALHPKSPPGSTPNSLALSPDENTLFVANACNNVVAVFDVSTPGKSRSLGFIPVGWYPTSVRVTPDGSRLLVANGKGLLPKANPNGPVPGRFSRNGNAVEYIARLFRGTMSIVDLPRGQEFLLKLGTYTADAYKSSPMRTNAETVSKPPPGNPIPRKPGDPSPIRYCIYIVKENRTYDQVLGDMPEGNGDPTLCLFPEYVTPNHHKLAREFVLLDNFYVESEVSADGHEWSMGAYATDFVEKLWPLGYGHNRSGKFPYVSEGNFPVAAPAEGYLWDRAREAGVTYRSYGEFVSNGPLGRPGVSKVKSLEGHFDEWFRGFDMTYSDLKRADRFISELRRFEREGEMPRLQIVRLPNDHTHGATPGARTPTAFLAENDLALGRIVQAISESRFWPRTAVFVVEDDAQNGPDHVDAHRTVAFVVSPYTKRRFVDSTLYSTSSMLRTMELILGLQPMSQFDAAATPMFHSFQAKATFEPYDALPANVNLDALNVAGAWGGDMELDFATEDAADDFLFNEIIWRSVRGPDSPMPAPVRAGFVFLDPTN